MAVEDGGFQPFWNAGNESGYIFIKWNRFLNGPMVRLGGVGGACSSLAQVR